MTVSQLCALLDARFPRSLSASWDNDGLMVCPDTDSEVKSVLISLDATSEAIKAAASGGHGVLLTHHPLIFRPINALDGSDVVSRRIMLALSLGISVISLHTRLDCADGGVADTLAEALSLTDAAPLLDGEGLHAGRLGKMPDGKRAAVCPGSGGDLVSAATAAGVDIFITGELSYNRLIDLSETMEVATLGHYESEAPILPKLAKILADYGVRSEVFG